MTGGVVGPKGSPQVLYSLEDNPEGPCQVCHQVTDHLYLPRQGDREVQVLVDLFYCEEHEEDGMAHIFHLLGFKVHKIDTRGTA